jgi:hypothetical protein
MTNLILTVASAAITAHAVASLLFGRRPLSDGREDP